MSLEFIWIELPVKDRGATGEAEIALAIQIERCCAKLRDLAER